MKGARSRQCASPTAPISASPAKRSNAFQPISRSARRTRTGAGPAHSRTGDCGFTRAFSRWPGVAPPCGGEPAGHFRHSRASSTEARAHEAAAGVRRVEHAQQQAPDQTLVGLHFTRFRHRRNINVGNRCCHAAMLPASARFASKPMGAHGTAMCSIEPAPAARPTRLPRLCRLRRNQFGSLCALAKVACGHCECQLKRCVASFGAELPTHNPKPRPHPRIGTGLAGCGAAMHPATSQTEPEPV